MKRLRTIAIVPTLFTLGNLICGFFAIVVVARVDAPTAESDTTPTTSEIMLTPPTKITQQLDRTDDTHNIMLCSWLIFLAMVFDALDGHVARLTRHTTDFGGQLDSLCDLVTFGVAPGFLLVKMCPGFTLDHRYAVWIIAGGFAACAALRLARFNVERADEDDHLWFNGLPAPAAAGVIAGYALLFYTVRIPGNEAIDLWFQWFLPVITVLLSLLMVSRIPYPHLVNQTLRGQRSFAHLVAVLFALGCIMIKPGYAVPAVASLFAVVPPIRYFWRRLIVRSTQEEPIF